MIALYGMDCRVVFMPSHQIQEIRIGKEAMSIAMMQLTLKLTDGSVIIPGMICFFVVHLMYRRTGAGKTSG